MFVSFILHDFGLILCPCLYKFVHCPFYRGIGKSVSAPCRCNFSASVYILGVLLWSSSLYARQRNQDQLNIDRVIYGRRIPFLTCINRYRPWHLLNLRWTQLTVAQRTLFLTSMLKYLSLEGDWFGTVGFYLLQQVIYRTTWKSILNFVFFLPMTYLINRLIFKLY